MKPLVRQRYLIRQNLIALIGFSLCFYFCYHIVMGDRGYLRLMSLDRRISIVSAEYRAESDARQSLQDKVVMMRPGSIDRDLLEERVRDVLGYVRPDERIILERH